MDHVRYLAVFDKCFESFIQDTLKKLDLSFSCKAIDSVTAMLRQRIWVVSASVLEKYTDDFIGNLNPFFFIDSDLLPESELNEYIAEAAKNPFFDKDYPLLRKKVMKVCELFALFFNEMIQRIRCNKDQICAQFLEGVEFNQIISFSSHGADTHNDGRASVIVETDAGKFLYKPHDCKTDIVFRSISTAFFGSTVKVPEVCYVCEDYSFVQFIKNRPAETEDDAALYYENMGGLCSLLTFFCAADFHEENILADGNMPVPVDYETAFMSIRPSDCLPSAEEDIYRSVLTTGMFSSKSDRTTSREVSPLFDLSDLNASAPVVNGKRTSVAKYIGSFKKGFESIYRRCLSLKEELLEFISEAQDMKVRVVLRNTYFYALFSDDMNSWKTMRSSEPDKSFLERLQSHYPEEIAVEELSSMAKADIPYFYCNPFSGSLLSRGKTLIEDFFPVSPFDYLKESFSLRNEEELEFELSVIDRLFSNTLTVENNSNAVIFKIPKPLDRAVELYRTIRKSIFESPSKKLCLIEARPNSYPGLVGMDFDDGKAGIALFFAALHLVCDDPEVKEESLALCNRLVGEVMNGIELNFSNPLRRKTFRDDLGITRALTLISRYIGQQFNSSALESLKSVEARSIRNSMKHDSAPVFTDTLSEGNAAIADCLIEKYKETDDCAYLDKAKDILLSKQSYSFIPEGFPALFRFGFMNGAAGIGYELLRLENSSLLDSVFLK